MLCYSFEAPRRGASNEYNNIFLFVEIRKYQYFLVEKKSPYLELCSTLDIKTAPLIRPLLGSTKDGLNSEFLLYFTQVC